MRLLLGTAVIALGLSSCGGSSLDQSGQNPQPGVSSSPSTPPIWSFTGLPGPANAQEMPVLMVKMENDPVVRPQTGLDSADLVFEELVEGGMTRFATVFQSNIPKAIGPVRSIRHVDAALAAPIADAFVFSGGAHKTWTFVNQKMPSNVSIITEGGIGVSRNPKHVAPHDVWLNPRKLLDSLANDNSPCSGFFATAQNAQIAPIPSPSPLSTDATAVPSATPTVDASPTVMSTQPVAIRRVSIHFSSWENPVWTWSDANLQWMRAEHTTPFTTPEGKQIGFTNLVIIFVKTISAGYHDPIGNYVPRSVLTGTGPGYLLVNGTRQPIFWHKDHVKDHLTLMDVSGQLITAPVGNTWVSLVPVDGGTVKFTKAPAQ